MPARRWDALVEADEALLAQRNAAPPGRNPLAPDDTDTAFETDSDMMEMCDMMEIM